MKNIKVNYAKKQELDFGIFPDKYAEGSIIVNKEFWIKYVNKRMEFEQMHYDLFCHLGWGKMQKLNEEMKTITSKMNKRSSK